MIRQVAHKCSDFIWPFLRPYMGVIPNPKMAFIFPISCILALIFPILIKKFPKCVGKGSFPKSQIKSLKWHNSSLLTFLKGAQWLSGRVLDSRPKGRGFEPHRRHCVVVLKKDINPSLVLVQPRKTHPYITERLLMGRKESNQTNKLLS